ncbi:MAG: bacteriohopanetetrol glucosamine biosynthesis glycosyltransferase HpnI [Alphaproteobacteria bacterium]
MTALVDVAALLACLGLLQCLAGLIAVSRFAARPTPAPAERPPVSVLKPLCGDEPLLEEALASCCSQTYPAFQIVFGIQDPSDPALAVVRRLQDRFPELDIAVVVDATPHGMNRKVANLINMLPSARHDILLVSDSDLHVAPDYLERLVAALEKPGTGLVTSLCVGLPAPPRWPARLGAAYISYGFLPGVLLSRALGRQDCLGSTVMLRRAVLERTGGLQSLVHLLAEDNVLGQRVCDFGLSVRLADTVPAATVPEPSLRALWLHEIRWVRTIRALAPLSLGASTIQYPLFWAAMTYLLSGGALWSLALFAGSWAVRAAAAVGIDRALRRKVSRVALAAPVWLLPLRDILSVVEIAASYWVDDVVWRGHRMGANSSTSQPERPSVGRSASK